MGLLIFKAIAIVVIVAISGTLLYALFLPQVEAIPPARRATVAWRMAAFLVFSPLALMAIDAFMFGRHRGYLDELFVACPAGGYLLCLAIVAIRERWKPMQSQRRKEQK